MKIILFEDNNVENLYPIALTRGVFDILCGGVTLHQALKQQFPEATFDYFVREYLKATVEQKFKPDNSGDDHVLFINAAVVPELTLLKELAEKMKDGKDFVLKRGDTIIATYVNNSSIYIKFSSENVLQYLEGLKIQKEEFKGKTFQYLWEVMVYNQEILKANLEILSENYSKHADGVFVGGGVVIEENVVFDSTNGPVVIADDVKVEAFTKLRGPLFVGKSSILKSFSNFYNSSIGPVCKIGGEVADSIVQGYSNKQHAGFLGHSYVGEWVNLGGGTSNSDMKNTLGEIKMAGMDTGQQFLGCVIGDYTKTSINTLIYTGKFIGVSSFLYDNVLNDVPSFSNLIPGQKMIECPLDIAHKIQAAARERRKVETTNTDKQLLSDIYSMTKDYRRKHKVKKGKLTLS